MCYFFTKSCEFHGATMIGGRQIKTIGVVVISITRKVHGLHDAVPRGRGAEGHQQGRRHDQDQEEYPVCRLVRH